uniref:Ion_trans domain-containing protein n=1 Tax=Macrostomum lignano TaxID=282301 RepID=A0A1I8FDD4_9PLAT
NSLVYVCYMLHINTVQPGSLEQWLMVLRCIRPLRIFCLMPQLRRVVYELVRGFREIFMVSVLLFVFIFIFAIYGVHIFGGRLGICNDRSKRTRAECVGTFYRKVFVTKLNLDGEAPQILVPRVWANPRNFNFDTIGNALLALFEVLSLEGWVEVRDVIMNRVSPVARRLHSPVRLHRLHDRPSPCLSELWWPTTARTRAQRCFTVDQRRWLDLKGRIKLTQPLRIPPRPNIVPQASDGNGCGPGGWTLLLVQRAQFNYSQAFTNCAVACTMLFMAEVALKCIALSFSGYWQSWRNRFDCRIVTLAGFLWIILPLHRHDSRWLVFALFVRRYRLAGGDPAPVHHHWQASDTEMLMLTVLIHDRPIQAFLARRLPAGRRTAAAPPPLDEVSTKMSPRATASAG